MVRNLSKVFILPSLALSVFLFSSHLNAEDVIKYGIPFQVERKERIDSENVKVTVLGESVVVAESEYESFVLSQYLSRAGIRNLTVVNVQDFIVSSLEEGNVSEAYLAMINLVYHPKVSQLEFVEFVETLAELPSSEKLFKKVLSKETALKEMPEVLGALVYYVAQVDLRWLKTKGVRHVYLNGEAVKRYFTSSFYRSLAAAEIDNIQTSLDALSELFGSEDPVYRKLNGIYIKLRHGISAVQRLDAEGMMALLDLTNSEVILSKVLPPVIVNTVHETARRALTENNAGKALTLLSWIELDWRTPTTHMLVAEALEKVDPSESSLVVGNRIERFLSFIAKKDPEVRKAYSNFLEKEILTKVKQGHFGQVEIFLDKLATVRPDPDRANDVIRFQSGIELYDAGYPQAGERILDSIHTRLSLTKTFKLLVRGLLIDLSILTCLILIPVLLIAWLVLRRSPAPGSYDDIEIDIDPVTDDYSEPISQPVFASLVGRSRDPVYINYTRLLRTFNLDSNARLKDIKHAYRLAIKEVHPDLNPNVDEKGKERFLDLTNSYEKLLKLRVRLGFPSE